MAREAHYNAADHIPTESAADPYSRPAFSLQNKLRRLVWSIARVLVFRFSPLQAYGWRVLLLRLFGATVGVGCRFHPSAIINSPWNLFCEDHVTVGDGVELYNPAPLHLNAHAVVSHEAYVCGATHDFQLATFPLLAYEMRIGAHAWICARASVGPGVNVGEGAVLGLASVATRDLEVWTVYGGAPATRICERISL